MRYKTNNAIFLLIYYYKSEEKNSNKLETNDFVNVKYGNNKQ